jgi:hypothetical protein
VRIVLSKMHDLLRPDFKPVPHLRSRLSTELRRRMHYEVRHRRIPRQHRQHLQACQCCLSNRRQRTYEVHELSCWLFAHKLRMLD